MSRLLKMKELLWLSTICSIVILVHSCNEGEVYRATFSCREYDQCVDSLLVRKVCDLGKYFDGKKCDDMWKIDCIIQGKCTDGQTYLRGICNQDYDVCTLGNLFKKKCPADYRFNGRQCVPKDTCMDTSGLAKTQNVVSNQLVADNIEPVCDDGQTSYHPSDCTMFQECVNGQWTYKSCPWMTHYDSKTNKCAYWDYTCSYGDACNENDTKSIFGRCSEYFKCINNKWEKMYCSANTYYQDGSCQMKSCPLRPVPHNCTQFMEPGSETILECPAEQLFDNVERQCKAKQDATCFDGECEDGKKTYVPADCTKYKICTESKWTEMSCSWLKHFDVNTNECCYYGYSCGTDQLTQVMTTKNTVEPVTAGNQTCSHEGDKEAVKHNCHLYKLCSNGKWSENKCYLWGKFDDFTKQCYYFRLWKVNCAY